MNDVSNDKELDDLLLDIMRSMEFNPDNWSTITNFKGFPSIGEGCWSKDNHIGVHECGVLMKPVRYETKNIKIKELLIQYVKDFQKRDNNSIGGIENVIKTQIDKCRELLEESYTDEQRQEMRKMKLVRILKEQNI